VLTPVRQYGFAPGGGTGILPRMTTPQRLFSLAAGVTALALLVPAAFAKGTPDERRDDIRQMRDTVLADLYKAKPELKARIKKAAGYAAFSNVGVNLIIASFAGGKGIVVDRKGNETFMKMGSAGIGLGLGVKDFRGVFVFYDQDKLEKFIANGWDFSGQADATAKSDEKGGQLAGSGNLTEGVELYQFTKNGLALQATLQGTKYWKDRDLN
jgi:lipid-binding SYLF domain-containing protein